MSRDRTETLTIYLGPDGTAGTDLLVEHFGACDRQAGAQLVFESAQAAADRTYTLRVFCIGCRVQVLSVRHASM